MRFIVMVCCLTAKIISPDNPRDTRSRKNIILPIPVENAMFILHIYNTPSWRTLANGDSKCVRVQRREVVPCEI